MFVLSCIGAFDITWIGARSSTRRILISLQVYRSIVYLYYEINTNNIHYYCILTSLYM